MDRELTYLPLDSTVSASPLRRSAVDLEQDPRLAHGPKLPGHISGNSWWWPWAVMTIVGLLIIGRLIYLQGIVGGIYRLRAEQNRTRIHYLPAPRGSMLDRYGQTVVENVPDFALTITPADIPTTLAGRHDWLTNLSTVTSLAVPVIEQALKDNPGRSTDAMLLQEHLPSDRALQLMVAIAEIPGVGVESLPTRHYRLGSAMASLIGYIGAPSPADLAARPQLRPTARVGKTGLEIQYDQALAGIDGQREVERDVHNQQQSILREQPAVPGNSLQLSIDAGLQQHLYDSLAKAVTTSRSTGGAAVAVDPSTGEILALVTAPTYDNNWFVTSGYEQEVQQSLTDSKKMLLDRAVSGQYPSGSIIKPLLSVAGLAEGVVTPSTTVVSSGGLTIGADTFPDWKAGGHGVTDLNKALAESVNTYFYILGGGYQGRPGLGVDRIVEYLQRFGWGSRLGLDLPGEASGFLPTKDWRTNIRPSPWRLGDTYHLAIGQGDLQVTPLQVVMAMAAIANGGTLYQPQLVHAIVDARGRTIQTVEPKALRLVDPQSSDITAVRNAMRQGVLNGSSRALQSLPVSAAGKTGTAQFGNQGKTHAWFAAFAPFDNPQIVIDVLIEGGGEGNATALPVAKDALQWYFQQSR